MTALLRYVAIALAVIVAYVIISPSSLGGWVLYVVVGAIAAGLIEAAFRRGLK